MTCSQLLQFDLKAAFFLHKLNLDVGVAQLSSRAEGTCFVFFFY